MIITLCGSARFEAWFHMWNEALTLVGHCVFGLGSYPSMHPNDGGKDWYTPDQKRALDKVHFDKIDASDGVLFLNVFAYMGESTLRELDRANKLKKEVYFLESWGRGRGIGGNHYQCVQDAFARFGCHGGSPVDTMSSFGGYRSVWDLLGPAGAYRSAIVKRLRAREVEALGYDDDGAFVTLGACKSMSPLQDARRKREIL